jgi:peptidoglycan hydrolase CwlO-like protein
MKKSLISYGISISLFLIALTGCSTKPKPSDLMRQQSSDLQEQADERKQLSKNWDKGTALVATGKKRVKKAEKEIKAAEKDLKKAQEALKEGEGEIAEGQKLVDESEKRFGELGGKLN